MLGNGVAGWIALGVATVALVVAAAGAVMGYIALFGGEPRTSDHDYFGPGLAGERGVRLPPAPAPVSRKLDKPASLVRATSATSSAT